MKPASTMNNGKFVISLDFELFWGFRGEISIEAYGDNIKGVHTLIPQLLFMFDIYKVTATFCTVGFLFCETKKELLEHLPTRLPQYRERRYSPYNELMKSVGDNHQVDCYHYAPQLIRLIQQYPEQEIGCHTFSHYYCLEPGQTIADFRADLVAAIKIAKKYGIQLTSFVFPKNQVNVEYLEVCKELGITCFRGTGDNWLTAPGSEEQRSQIIRALRLADAYINISGQNSYSDDYMRHSNPIDIPASRFLRAYSPKLRLLEPLRLKRIQKGMTYAAKHNLTYHLWWHPHNFGINQEENLAFLRRILLHYQELHRQFGFQSYTMSQLAERVQQNDR
jgi:hypothetical protein